MVNIIVTTNVIALIKEPVLKKKCKTEIKKTNEEYAEYGEYPEWGVSHFKYLDPPEKKCFVDRIRRMENEEDCKAYFICHGGYRGKLIIDDIRTFEREDELYAEFNISIENQENYCKEVIKNMMTDCMQNNLCAGDYPFDENTDCPKAFSLCLRNIEIGDYGCGHQKRVILRSPNSRYYVKCYKSTDGFDNVDTWFCHEEDPLADNSKFVKTRLANMLCTINSEGNCRFRRLEVMDGESTANVPIKTYFIGKLSKETDPLVIFDETTDVVP
jgi:hypothetical protein